MTKPLRVFISSTSEDLKRYRAAAAEVVRDAGWIADVMDHFPADPDPILVMCQRRVGECDLFLLLQAFRRGGVPDVAQGGDGVTSYTAFELRAAPLRPRSRLSQHRHRLSCRGLPFPFLNL